MPSYSYSQLKSRINAGIKGKIGILVDARETLNQAARAVTLEIDLRSMRRKTQLSPPLFSKIFEYAAPTDLKDYAIIDINPLTDRKQVEYELVPFEQFMRRQDNNSVALSDNDFIRKILINALPIDKTITPSSLDSLTAGGGTWVLFGDGENLAADNDNFVRGGGAISWDISSAGGTTAGIQNSGLNSFDITDYLGGNSSLFVWAYINSATDLTNYILEIGSSTSDYYSKTITAVSDGTAFKAGWNLLRFDLSSLTTTGTPVDTTVNFIAIYMTKATGKVSETDYRFDDILIKKGEIHDIVYYSKYAWQDTNGAYLESSTADTDLLNADTTEFDLFVAKGVELAGEEVDENEASERFRRRYLEMKKQYMLTNPSEAKQIIQTYADFITM